MAVAANSSPPEGYESFPLFRSHAPTDAFLT